MSRQLQDCQVAIVGLGLMGGSLAGALRGKCRAVVGVARRDANVKEASRSGLIDWGTTDLAEGVGQADVVVLATPVRVVMHQLAEIGPLLPEGCGKHQGSHRAGDGPSALPRTATGRPSHVRQRDLRDRGGRCGALPGLYLHPLPASTHLGVFVVPGL